MEARPRDILHPKWQTHDSKFRKHWRVPDDFRPWTSRASFRGSGLQKTPRVLSILDAVAIEKSAGKRLSEAALRKCLQNNFVDVSQSLERKTYTNSKGLTRTQTTSTLLYSFDSDSVVLGREMLLLQGQPKSLQIEGQKDSVLRSLAGEGMAVPCVGLVVWALMLTKQFPDGPDDAMILD